MTEQTTYSSRSGSPSGLATGFILFASVMMIMAGIFQAFSGLVAIIDDEFYVTTPNYVLQFDTTTWGWIHLLLGVIVALAGASLLAGKFWARTVAVIVAAVSMFANFAALPYYPFWAILVIVLDVFVIWAVTAHGDELKS